MTLDRIGSYLCAAIAAILVGLFLFSIFLVLSAQFSPAAHGRDNGQWGHVDPVIRDWVKSLKNKNGVGCCDTADGYDAQWDTEGDHYRVRIDGAWHVVPAEAVLDIANRLGVAKVWYVYIDSTLVIRCFLPGPGA